MGGEFPKIGYSFAFSITLNYSSADAWLPCDFLWKRLLQLVQLVKAYIGAKSKSRHFPGFHVKLFTAENPDITE